MSLLSGVTMYDGIMALIILFTTMHGFWKGAAWQIAPIMSLVLGYMIAMPMSVTSAHYFGDPPLNRLYALVTIYIGVALVVYLMVRSFRAGIDKAKLTEFDRHIGALLGVVKGLLVTLAITVILVIQSPIARELILKSESSTIAAKIISSIYPILPQAMHQILRPYLQQLGTELPLDIHDIDPQNGTNNLLPDSGPILSPTTSPATTSAARRAPDDDYSPTLRRSPRSTATIDDEYDDALPPAPPPRRRSQPAYDRGPQANRRYDSATNTDRRNFTNDRDSSEMPDAPTLTPTPADENDPFLPRGPRRSSR